MSIERSNKSCQELILEAEALATIGDEILTAIADRYFKHINESQINYVPPALQTVIGFVGMGRERLRSFQDSVKAAATTLSRSEQALNEQRAKLVDKAT